MTWVSKKPDSPGWFWYRRSENDAAITGEVFHSRRGLVTKLSGNSFSLPVDDFPGEWSSEPIPEPTEATTETVQTKGGL